MAGRGRTVPRVRTASAKALWQDGAWSGIDTVACGWSGLRMGEVMGEAREAGGANLVPGTPWVPSAEPK